ncbi:hypothetical protein LMH87_001434 [Akanthomyces muscarius]|uniref:DUF7068 domain-containing protein n=1 Tax=Akanthomyces muscarius TaxID=2231603 RepID=A0A9W8UHJ4_AKAMU|nr:hypothetical protein LMH87_001434 [Akanthomyces muscarius]KAJ4146875.1 hypothetical protein LMH87_001434 [Akanthomyces muscarius]
MITYCTRPNIIITSRPFAKAPPNLDLELETIGFGPDQVNEYIEISFTNPETGETDQVKVDKVRSFLQERWLIQGLVRIPIQLDALCYTWEEFDPETVPSTMTGMYNSIVQKLWKKDVVRLEKVKEGYAKDAHAAEIEGRVTAEIALVECLAFNGLHNGVIDFAPVHRASVVQLYPLQDLSLDETLSRLSFLRTSDMAANIKHRNYHFIHLTFQEYFAARYFVRQWKEQGGQLQCLTFSNKDTETKASHPMDFLQRHKYTAHYDIFWRFVAGLLDGSGQAADFMSKIEEEPLDLLGPTHQRLVMHCLSEISSLPTGPALEDRLAQWLLFECKFNKSAMLASEIEFPEVALMTALLDKSSDVQKIILQSLASRALIPRSIAEVVAVRLGDEDRDVRSAALWALGGRAALPDNVLTAVAARLGDKDKGVRSAAVEALGGRAALPDEVLTAVAARLGDIDGDVRWAAFQVLGRRAALPDDVLMAVAARLGDIDRHVRWATVQALRGRAALPDDVLTAVAARLDDKDGGVRWAAVRALGRQAALPDDVLTAVAARLDDKDWHVRWAAVDALGGRVALPDDVLMAVVAWLGDEDRHVRSAAVEALGGRVALPDDMLAAVAARLDDEDGGVRLAAVEALGGQATLSDDVLTAVAARLDDEDEDRHVRSTAVDILMHRHEKFCCTLLKGPLFPSFYKALLERSFEEQLSWCIAKDNFCINMPDVITEFSADIQQNEFWEWINGARPADYPSSSGEESLSQALLSG